MTSREVHVGSVVPVTFLAVALGHHPLVALPLLGGVLLPELDALREDTHRSWALHTFLAPAVAHELGSRVGAFAAFPWLSTGVHFVTLGVALHLFADFVYPRRMTHEGAAWPVRPTVWSAPWGLLWLGLSWLVQWYVYLVPSFLPWLVGA